MKKNKMMRAASALLVATLLTTCVIAGTFAKYTSSAHGTDTARVAKWGVSATATAKTFATSYAKDDQSFTLNANSVASTAEVVAPGTTGNMAAIQLSGQPEVAVRVSYQAAFALNDQWKTADGTYYCPLEITVNDTTIKGTTFDSAATFAAAVNAAIDGYSKDYAAGTDLSTVGNDNLKISWSWPYAGDDAKDTELGTAADAGTVTLDVTATVTQID